MLRQTLEEKTQKRCPKCGFSEPESISSKPPSSEGILSKTGSWIGDFLQGAYPESGKEKKD